MKITVNNIKTDKRKAYKGKGNPFYGKKHSDETKRKMRLARSKNQKGRKHSEETKQKMSDSAKGKDRSYYSPSRFKNGNKSPMKGKRHTKEVKKKISDANKGKLSQENHPNWKGGKSFENYPKEFNDELKEIVRDRDSYICQECGVHQDELKRKLSVHHIDYDKKNNDPENLISLCQSCHVKTNYSREDWINYFKQK